MARNKCWIDGGWAAHWATVRAKVDSQTEQGRVMITPSGKSRLIVTAPYCTEFLELAHSLGGRYRARTKRWTFHESVAGKLVAECRKLYGPHKVKVEM